MTKPIKTLNGATKRKTAKLREIGIMDNEQLLKSGASPSQRRALADHCGCDVKEILELANRADLARIKGIAGVYSHLLECSGVDTVKELATRRADNLHEKILATNMKKQLTARPPTISILEDWIEQATELPRILTY